MHCYLFLSPVKLNSHDVPCVCVYVCVCVCVPQSQNTVWNSNVKNAWMSSSPEMLFHHVRGILGCNPLQGQRRAIREVDGKALCSLSWLLTPSFSLNLSVLPLSTASPITSLFTQVNASKETNKETGLACAHTHMGAHTHTHIYTHTYTHARTL